MRLRHMGHSAQVTDVTPLSAHPPFWCGCIYNKQVTISVISSVPARSPGVSVFWSCVACGICTFDFTFLPRVYVLHIF